ncbi:hypothetical protein [Paracraurococcus lichenis]|uniref:Uncharacterized protein n=1 Tax=Paracraurococcus lichenis TaxID=3064888 RepID=A0ABT9DX52_9PROT|nr:hypothetical protein [Paracraurococcus sp. LOR1-02]MDO9708481.1 hypothetical protein [Paracraurococcus sp. LOR1-02]
MAAPPSAWRDRLKPHVPKLVETTHDHAYGDVWERPQPSTREEVAEASAYPAMAAGWPAAMTASQVAVDVFDDQDRARS